MLTSYCQVWFFFSENVDAEINIEWLGECVKIRKIRNEFTIERNCGKRSIKAYNDADTEMWRVLVRLFVINYKLMP